MKPQQGNTCDSDVFRRAGSRPDYSAVKPEMPKTYIWILDRVINSSLITEVVFRVIVGLSSWYQ